MGGLCTVSDPLPPSPRLSPLLQSPVESSAPQVLRLFHSGPLTSGAAEILQVALLWASMRTQAPGYYQPTTLSNIEIFLKIVLPAIFIKPTVADNPLSLFNRGPNSECVLRQFKCKNERCIQSAWMCDGTDDCGDNSDETAPECNSLLYNCTNQQYTCRNGFCIPKEFRCDRERDCPDGSDEVADVCGVGECDEGDFKCAPNFCIPPTWVCDGKLDCHDGRDELHCNKTCAPYEFSCPSGQCISKAYICDGDSDCLDGSDEKNCTIKECEKNDFQCGDKSCITNKWRCDGDYDCLDKSDEKNCPTMETSFSVCATNEFTCPDRIHCVKLYMLCDGEFDCPDGGDEALSVCENVTCREGQFQCRNYHCIEGHKRCDGHKDCIDGSDEEDCQMTKSCKKEEFNCGDGFCIPMSKVCDKHRDCPFGEDEPRGKCNINECQIRNGGCSDICVDTPTGHYCECNEGYKLINNFTCVDIDECENPGSCSQICVNKRGSFSCECLSGYKKDPADSTRCVANATEEGFLIFTRRNDIRRINLDGKNMSTIASDTNSSSALDFFYQAKELFWSDNEDNKIYKAPINATHLKVVLHNVSTCDGLAVDWIYRNIYWTDTGKKTIEVSNIEGNFRKTLIKDNLGEPRALVLNPLDGWMFWSDWGTDASIERAGLDGSNRRKIVSNEVKWPNALTLDLVRNRLYWIDAKTNVISSVNFDGSGRSLILKDQGTLHHPYSVTIFEDYMYWTDWDKQTIFKANKFDGSNTAPIIGARMLQNPMVVKVYHPYNQPEGLNRCSNMNCSHLCLPVPNVNSLSPKAICACPDDYSLLSDGRTCYNNLLPPTVITVDTTLMPDNPVIIDNDNNNSDVELSFYIIIGIVSLLVIVPLVSYAAYKYYRSKTINKITFDYPYTKPGEDMKQVKKPFNDHLIGQFDEEAQEPLRRPGTNSFL